MAKRTPPETRFWARVQKGDSCWNWVGCADPSDGHAQFWDGNRLVYVHRFAYELMVGPIPSGMAVCHTCDNPVCVNPKHLWVGTWGDNNRDRARKGRSFKRTVCLHGHPYNEANTAIANDGARYCRACSVNSARAYRARLAAQRA